MEYAFGEFQKPCEIYQHSLEDEDDISLLKIAERKKIRKMEDVDSNGDHHQPVTGSELSSVGVRISILVISILIILLLRTPMLIPLQVCYKRISIS